MSLADDLLNSSSGMNTRLADMDLEPHIVIGEDRFVIVPDELKRIGVQYDHKVETVKFDCPRHWDGHDMSKMKIYINYTRADGLLGMYLAENVSVDEQNPNIMHFDWTLTRNVTGINGPIVFMVCVKKTNRDGNEEVHWNSERNTEMYISEGLEGEEVIQDQHPDIFTQMLQRMDEIVDISTDSLTRVEGRYTEFVTTMDSTRTTIINRANELETMMSETQSIMTETQTMVRGIEKIATPEAMQNYSSTFLEENPELLKDAVDDFYYASDDDIDDIIDGTYVDVPDIGGDIIDEDVIITDEDIDNIIDGLFEN